MHPCRGLGRDRAGKSPPNLRGKGGQIWCLAHERVSGVIIPPFALSGSPGENLPRRLLINAEVRLLEGRRFPTLRTWRPASSPASNRSPECRWGGGSGSIQYAEFRRAKSCIRKAGRESRGQRNADQRGGIGASRIARRTRTCCGGTSQPNEAAGRSNSSRSRRLLSSSSRLVASTYPLTPIRQRALSALLRATTAIRYLC